MGLRATIGHGLDDVLGKSRTDQIRASERKLRTRVASAIAPTEPKPAPKPPAKKKPAAKKPAAKKAAAKKNGPAPIKRASEWTPPDPYVPHPQPTMTRHDLLRGLHEALTPRTYFEIGVRAGHSLTLSHVPSVGVDPAYDIAAELHCDLDLIRLPSDDFFAREDPFAHFKGLPVDLAFIDGMHLSEFALRDFVNTEPYLAPTSVVVLDDMLPRNALEASRERKTHAWAGDVYKVAEILMRRRPDLLVLPVNTKPTGTVVIVGVDPLNAIGKEIVESELDYCTSPDPQPVPQTFMNRSEAVNAEHLLALDVWPELARRREAGVTDLQGLWGKLRALPRGL